MPPKTTVHSQQNAGAFLERSEDIGALMPKARQLVELRQALARLLPDSLSRSCGVANTRQGRLVLFAENSVVAARLKLLAPALRDRLSQAGHQVNSIVIEVQLPPAGAEPGPRHKAVLGHRAGEALLTLAGRLPDSPLKDALRRLAGRARPA